MVFPDIHRHLVSHTEDEIREELSRGDAWTIFNLQPEQGHWAEEFPHLNFSMGIHPWYIPDDVETAKQTLLRWASLPNVCLIGETGLDGIRDHFVSDRGYEMQEPLFRWHIQLAEQLQKPLVIHCVKRFNALLSEKRRGQSTVPWIIHGYRRHVLLARQLVNHGFFLSFGTDLLYDERLTSTLVHLPANRIFLETDTHTEVPVSVLYKQAARAKQISEQVWVRQIKANFFACCLRI